MYAAAGGASLASRQARQRRKLDKKPKKTPVKVHVNESSPDEATMKISSKHFHHLPSNYLRTPQAQMRKLSAACSNRNLMPITEDNDSTLDSLNNCRHVLTRSATADFIFQNQSAANKSIYKYASYYNSQKNDKSKHLPSEMGYQEGFDFNYTKVNDEEWCNKNGEFVKSVSSNEINKHEHYLETNVGLLSILRGPSTFANAILYFGLCTTAIGLIIAFVGTGEKGFKTGELRLIGPSLIGFGLASCFIRIMLCICPSKCISSDRSSTFEKELDHSTKLLQIKECDILAKSNIINTTTSSNSKLMEGGFETLKQIATSSIFMQNELKSSKNKISPFIHNRKQLQNDDMCSTHKSNNENHWSILPQPFFYKIPQIQNKITAESTSKAVDAKMNNEPVELISLKSLSINEKEIVLSPSCLQNIE